jgi:hypothetical protein
MTGGLSSVAQLSWQFGASEAFRAKYQHMEKEQLLIGI